MKLQLIILSLFVTIIHTVSLSQNQAYSFFIAGHSYGIVGGQNKGLHPQFVKEFEYLKTRQEIELGFLLGDIIRFPNEEGFDSIDSEIEKLGFPVCIAAGNHEMKNRELFEARYGPSYYKFMHNGDLFIILNPNIDAWNISGDQLAFLKKTLDEDASESANIFVLFHQLLWVDNDNIYNKIIPNSFEGRADSINFWTEVEPLFKNLKNNVVFCAGDLGAFTWCQNFMYDSYANISLVASGMGDGEGDNFIIVNVDENKNISFEIICLSPQKQNCDKDITKFKISDAK
jgi:hypothetical protein